MFEFLLVFIGIYVDKIILVEHKCLKNLLEVHHKLYLVVKKKKWNVMNSVFNNRLK